jgi:hypothetical protein
MACSLLACTGTLLFIVLHIRHYPVAASLLSLFLLRIIIDAKVEKIIVSEDRLEIVTRRLLPFLTKRQVVLFSAVETFHIPPGRREMFLVRYKDGDCRQIFTSIRRAQFEQAVGVMGTLSLIRQVRRDSLQGA